MFGNFLADLCADKFFVWFSFAFHYTAITVCLAGWVVDWVASKMADWLVN